MNSSTSKSFPYRLIKNSALCLFVAISSCGCRKILSSAGPSHLWPKYIQREGDLAWTNQGCCENRTHQSKAISDYQIGFIYGHYQTAYNQIQPAGPCVYQNPPVPKRIAKRSLNSRSPEMIAGYQHGSHIAASSTIGGFLPGEGPLPGVSRVYVRR